MNDNNLKDRMESEGLGEIENKNQVKKPDYEEEVIEENKNKKEDGKNK